VKAYRLKEPNFKFQNGTYSICWWGINTDKPFDLKTRAFDSLVPYVVYMPPYNFENSSFNLADAKAVLSDLLYGLSGIFNGFRGSFAVDVPLLDRIDNTSIPYDERQRIETVAHNIPIETNIVILLTRFEPRSKRNSAHNLAKIHFTKRGIPSQVITTKVMKGSLRRDGEYIAMLRNIAVCMYKKLGGTPWILSRSLGIENVYVGFRYLYHGKDIFITAQLFDHQGSYVAGTLHRYPRDNKLSGTKQVLREILTYLAERRRNKRVVVHQIGEIFAEDLESLKEPFKEYPFEFAIVSIKTPTNPAWRIYKTRSMDNLVERGICVPLDTYRAVLMLTGSPLKVPEGTPQGRLIELKYPQPKDEETIMNICHEIFNLSDLNFSYAMAYKGIPITADFATRVVERCVLGGYPETIDEIEELSEKSKLFNAYW